MLTRIAEAADLQLKLRKLLAQAIVSRISTNGCFQRTECPRNIIGSGLWRSGPNQNELRVLGVDGVVIGAKAQIASKKVEGFAVLPFRETQLGKFGQIAGIASNLVSLKKIDARRRYHGDRDQEHEQTDVDASHG